MMQQLESQYQVGQYQRVDVRTLGYLGRALSLEYSAVQQYMAQAAVAESWGLLDAARRFREETVEEMRHAERLVKRLLGVGAVPNASCLRPVMMADSLAGLLRLDQQMEAEILAHYEEAAGFCEATGDLESAEFFHGLLRDEVAHAEEIGQWLLGLGKARAQGGDERASF